MRRRPPRSPFSRQSSPALGSVSCPGSRAPAAASSLTPLILFAGWSEARVAAGISAAFILANSISGLLGNAVAVQAIPAALPLWLVAVAAGGLLGAELGARRLGTPNLRRALVLVIAGLKLMFLG